MRLDTIQSLVIILMVALATQITRWTPFLLFSGERKLPRVVEDLGKLLAERMRRYVEGCKAAGVTI